MTLTIQDVKVVGLVLAIPTAIITIIRLTVRARARNLGLDDAFAASSLAGLLVFYTALFLHFDPHLLAHYSFTTRYVMYYVISQGFYWVIWSARLSLMFIVIRITPPSNEGTRRTLYFAAWSFGAAWAVLAAQVIWVCEKKVAWKVTPAPQCPIGLPVAIAQLISDILADSILIIAPLKLLWHLDSTGCPQRRRLLFAFSASIVTTTTSLIHAYYVMRVGGSITLFLALLEVCSSLFVCNLAIIVSLVSRIYSRGKSRLHSHRSTAGCSLELRSRANRDAFGLRVRQGPESLAIENGTVVSIQVETHVQNDRKDDPEALSLASKSDAATHQQKPCLP